MQLTYPKAPSNGVQTLRPALQAALQTRGFGANRQFANAAAAKISLSEAYRGYSLSLDDLSAGKGLRNARIGDWHYLVFADDVTIADAQLAEVRGHVEISLEGLERDRVVAELGITALDDVEIDTDRCGRAGCTGHRILLQVVVCPSLLRRNFRRHSVSIGCSLQGGHWRRQSVAEKEVTAPTRSTYIPKSRFEV